MVSQIRRSYGFYTAKMANAADTPSGSGTRGEVARGTLQVDKARSLRQEVRVPDPRVLLHQRSLIAT